MNFTLVSRIGKIRMYDAGPDAPLRRIRDNFAHLTIDPYVREGFRRKHIARLEVVDREPHVRLRMLPNEPLLQSHEFNPVHGGVRRSYPALIPVRETAQVVNAFVRCCDLRPGDVVLAQAQRITCEPGAPGLPSVEDWHQDGVAEIGVFCVARYNIKGGRSQFRDAATHATVLDAILPEGRMVIFDDIPVQHRVTPIDVKDPETGTGYRDVLLLSHGSR